MRHLSHPIIYIFIAFVITFICSCDNYQSGVPDNDKEGKPAELELTVLPGECLISPELSLSQIRTNVGQTGIQLVFKLDMDCDLEKLNSLEYRYIPSNSIFDSFGENSSAVKKAYQEFWQDVSYGHQLFYISTVFYSSGLTLTADKEFAGMPAGENVSSAALADLWPVEFFQAFANNGFANDYCLPSSWVAVNIPKGELQIVDDSVSLTLSIPVKKALYLTWFNNRLTDENAPLPYSDETLSCSFTISKNLK